LNSRRNFVAAFTVEPLVNRYGVSRIQLTKFKHHCPLFAMTLQVNKNSPNWQATVSRFGGVVVLPTGGSNAATIVDTSPNHLGVCCTSNQSTTRVATIQSVEIAEMGRNC